MTFREEADELLRQKMRKLGAGAFGNPPKEKSMTQPEDKIAIEDLPCYNFEEVGVDQFVILQPDGVRMEREPLPFDQLLVALEYLNAGYACGIQTAVDATRKIHDAEIDRLFRLA
ncbi:hypothetical protein [Lignipirellula cremea]|uniref:Uncharacterized protein n=1 Tax=Lignipirellula cremea TaxID=2528010 RepID=A0A518DTJ8_9BACT|nr:hypothetical protein [Lignipirellula cremea]QDU95166.1 hypothetical protein Pla8534_29780 [Lignipirellula cremea]